MNEKQHSMSGNVTAAYMDNNRCLTAMKLVSLFRQVRTVRHPSHGTEGSFIVKISYGTEACAVVNLSLVLQVCVQVAFCRMQWEFPIETNSDALARH